MSFPLRQLDDASGKLVAKWYIAAYCCVSAALILVLTLTAWGAYVDLTEVRATFLHGEINRFRSHAIRTVGRIQDHLRSKEMDLRTALNQDNWLRDYWSRWVLGDKSRAYVAVVDNRGVVLMHSHGTQTRGQLGNAWYDRALPDAGDDVVETHCPALTGGKTAYDIQVPIIFDDYEIGTYHSGLDPAWFDEALAEKSASTWNRWAVIFAAMLAVVAIAGISLYQIVRRTIILREVVEMSRVRQFADLGELAAGIAHEIRNPINTIRLNLHALQQMQRAQPTDSNGESLQVITEANREIERVEELMKIMLGYARPEKPLNENLDLVGEVEATLGFLKHVLEGDGIAIQVQLPPLPQYVRIDRNRFRQIMLNLLRNAREAVGGDGQIQVRLSGRRGAVEVVVADNGPGVPLAERERIFDPFYSTKALGTGLGLALVKRFVEEANGSAVCEANGTAGALFRLNFPEAKAPTSGAVNGVFPIDT
jgi:signal transduction histidine kinase